MNADADPEKMDVVSKTIFRPIYPVIARQILACCAAQRGICVDAGTGPGSLAIEIARAGGFLVYAMDVSPGQSRIAHKNIGDAAMADRVVALTGDVHRMPFADDSVDLIVSRGSVFFWEDLAKAFGEVRRALKPGGLGYIGGGLGNSGLRAKIKRETGQAELNGDPGRKKLSPDEIIAALKTTRIHNYTVINDDTGLWAIIKKPEANGP